MSREILLLVDALAREKALKEAQNRTAELEKNLSKAMQLGVRASSLTGFADWIC